MPSNYRRLGQYIREVNVRNIDLRVTTLLGVSIEKVFMPSIANIIGTDMTTYKVIKRGMFAYGPVTSRNGDKISIALLEEHEEAIVSQAYFPFEVIDHEELNPEYLMMWFRRPEFDRYARFKSHGSAREIFDWAEMCNTELPVPHIDLQRAMVQEYNTITERIKLNERLNCKLEETAQSLYRHWFEDFEFPYDFEKGEPSLQGQPYKSTGGEMVWCEELEREIPKGWNYGSLSDLMDFNNGKSKPIQNGDYPVYGGNGIMGWTSLWNEENLIAIGRVGAYCGSLYRITGRCWVSDNAICGKSKAGYHNYCFDLLKAIGLNSKSEGSGQPLLTQAILNAITILLPEHKVQAAYEEVAKMFYITFFDAERETKALVKLESLVLAKISTLEITVHRNITVS